jgi:hypothetical protein
MAKKRVPEPESASPSVCDLQDSADRVAALLIAGSEAYLGDELHFGNWLKIVPKEKVADLRDAFIAGVFEDSIKLVLELSVGLAKLIKAQKAEVA